MNAPERGDLTTRLDAVIAEARGKVNAFQEEAEASRHETRARFERFLPIAERIVAIARGRLEALKERLRIDVIPSRYQTERYYSRSVTLDVKTERAGVIKLGFRLSHDSEVWRILLDYHLEIIPVSFRFNPHDRLELPLDAFDEAAVAQWFDDRLVEFANVFVEMHLTRHYRERAMVSDTLAGIVFPKDFAAARLEHGGATHSFISEETRREFAQRHGLNP